MSYRMILNETGYFGAGAIENIPQEVKTRGFKKAFVITDKPLVDSGVVGQLTKVLDDAHIIYDLWPNAEPNPAIRVIQSALDAFHASGADFMIGIGGGSSMDTAKAVGIVDANPEFNDIRSLEGEAKTKNPSTPVIAIPTTAGTGAEVTINYVITDEENERKFVAVDAHSIPAIAVVDSNLMMNMPKSLMAATGMDALTQAIEGYITKGAWEMTDMMHIKAIKMCAESLRPSYAGDAKAREEMSIAQYICGMGFSNAGLGLVHGMAHPLGAWYHMPHGVACAMCLPVVMQYNATSTGERFRDIGEAMGIEGIESMDIEEARQATINAVQKLSDDLDIPRHLAEFGAKPEDMKKVAKDALADVCTGGNPKDPTVDDIYELYMSIM